MQKISKNKGITLVALIIIIIILMILAGVVIATVNGNNGILGKAKRARGAYQNSANEENNRISSYENEIDKASLDVASSRENNSNYKKVLLFNDDNGATSGTFSFLDNHTVSEFDNILAIMQYTGDSSWISDEIIETESWILGEKYVGGVIFESYSNCYVQFTELTQNSFNIGYVRNLKLLKIYGIKY